MNCRALGYEHAIVSVVSVVDFTNVECDYGVMVLVGGLLMRYYGYYTYMFKFWILQGRKVVVLS